MLNSIQFTQVNSLRELFQAKTLIFNSPLASLCEPRVVLLL